MEVRRLTDFNRIAEIYYSQMQTDFPSNEIKPLIAIENALENGIYECYGLFRGRITLGYAFLLRSGSRYLLDYFAILEAYRNKGLGSVFLNRLSKLLSESAYLICEVDAPDKEKDPELKARCEKRIQFYLHNGFQQTRVTSCIFGADYRVLIMPGTEIWDDKEIAESYAALYKSILPEFFFKNCFSVTL